MCSMELTWNIYETWVKAKLRQKISNHSGCGSHFFVIQMPEKIDWNKGKIWFGSLSEVVGWPPCFWPVQRQNAIELAAEAADLSYTTRKNKDWKTDWKRDGGKGRGQAKPLKLGLPSPSFLMRSDSLISYLPSPNDLTTLWIHQMTNP